MKPLIDALRCMGVEIIDDGGRLPLRVRGGNIKRRVVEISGNVSSQYISSLLFLGVKEGIDIHVLDDAVSRGYIDLTLNVLEEAGVNFYRDGYRFFHVDPMDIGGKRYEVPGDYSLVSFFIVAAAINGRIRILGLDRRVVQPDRRLLDIVREMGGVVKWSHGVLEVSSSPLEGIEISLRSSPDLLPVVSVLAAFADGETRIYGVEHARYKESDRIFSTSLNLRRMGVDVEEYSDGLIIKGGSPKGGVFYSYGDHRVAMAFIIASLFLDRPSLIRDVGCIWDSYPYFLGDFSGVGGRFELV
jgi:3-phosphoshikimate 1-carboxyvinyltransferase